MVSSASQRIGTQIADHVQILDLILAIFKVKGIEGILFSLSIGGGGLALSQTDSVSRVWHLSRQK